MFQGAFHFPGVSPFSSSSSPFSFSFSSFLTLVIGIVKVERTETQIVKSERNMQVKKRKKDVALVAYMKLDLFYHR